MIDSITPTNNLIGNKTKSKDRLDKFYRYAKEQGYRSRAAFKLIQLNKKYHFLEDSTILVDLCAAPGGWLQVASKFMKSASIIIGVDLDPIKPIPNVKTFQTDITTQKCLNQIKQEIKHMKVDVVLNDGAPNVGSEWALDAYNQCELVMHGLKLATQLLRPGGYFVTKIFRSQHYMSLIWLFNKFFDLVEANKPEASRTQSAEIFVVCSKYKNPDYIDPKFFDAKWVFANSEGDFMQELNNNNIHSIRKALEVPRRQLMRDDCPATLFKKIGLSQFINCKNPYPIISEFNGVDLTDKTIDTQSPVLLGKTYGDLVKYPEDFEEICNDLRLCSKSQVAMLLKWRSKVLLAIEKTGKTKDKVEEKVQEQPHEEPNQADLQFLALKKEERMKEKMKEKQLYRFAGKNANEQNMFSGVDQDGELAGFDFLKHEKQIRKGKYAEIEEDKDDNP